MIGAFRPVIGRRPSAFVGSETVQSMTIDLNGYDLTLTAASMTIKNGFDLEICNGYLDLQGPVSQYSNFAIESNSSLSLNSVSLSSTGSVLYPRGDAATVCVNDSYIFTSGGYIIATNAASVENYNVSIIVKDSHLVCESTTVLLNVAGSLDISNSILEGELQCLIVRAGSANVSNTLFMFTPPDEDWIDTFLFRWSSGNCMTVSAIVVGNLNSTAYVADATLDLNNCELITGKDLDRSIVVAQDSKNGMIAKVTLSDNDGFDNIYTNNGSELTAVSSDVGEITMPVVTESA